jgi:prolyl 4-hydroxylase
MHYPNVTTNNPLGDKQKFYDELISGCVERYNQEKEGHGNRCLDNERDRVAMSLRQPKSMYNYVSNQGEIWF